MRCMHVLNDCPHHWATGQVYGLTQLTVLTILRSARLLHLAVIGDREVPADRCRDFGRPFEMWHVTRIRDQNPLNIGG